ncbi:TELO2-interacting protein 1 homolog isoform X2 [Rhodamnia argentea]|uniref:TELO2-interacting protein 1 homolog isoform X2 n=1 Tax=Rhodamnia argentea TaxID=178133 RepID=A0A8B8P1N8_9MYRT|nr:TELO2-interacting protein 1 homolog isoform X2 [Rhodamnia argentea]
MFASLSLSLSLSLSQSSPAFLRVEDHRMESMEMTSCFMDEEEAEKRSRVFAELKPYCLDLLDLVQHPQKHSPALSALLCFLRDSPTDSLQPFFDYTLFPLLLLLDVAVDDRTQHKIDPQDHGVSSHKPHRVSDIAAEAVLQCLEELLKKCYLGSVDQMVVILKKLTYGALLSPSVASEEFREGIIKCFRALLLNLLPCSDSSCSCEQINGFPSLLVGDDMLTHPVRRSRQNLGGECLLAFLQTQTASAAIGHWLSLLLEAADFEAVRGHRGSAKLRIEAFLTLRVLVAKVGTSDALAFFLPGVVSKFTKVLGFARTMSSGAAGNIEAINQSIRGLAEYLMIVLEDDANLLCLEMSLNSKMNSEIYSSTDSFLRELRRLPIRDQGHEVLSENSVIKVESKKTANEIQEQTAGSSKGLQTLTVNRTKNWVEETSANVHKLLSATFPHICVHPAKRLRRGLLAAIEGILTKCNNTLKESKLLLLECLCALVVDESEEISASAQEFLRYIFSFSRIETVERDIAEMLSRLLEKLPKMVLQDEESFALSSAQQLLVVMYFSGPCLVVDRLLHSPVTAARFFDVLAMCLGQHSVFAGSLEKLVLARSSSVGYIRSVAELKSQSHLTRDQHEGAQVKEIGYSQENIENSSELPRMPPWFENVGSQKLYRTLAQIVRLVGLSLLADSRCEGHLSAIADIPLGYVRKLVSEIRIRDYNKESWQSWYYRTGSGQLLQQASTAVCILNEMIFGLSDKAFENFEQMFRKSTVSGDELQKLTSGLNDRHSPTCHAHDPSAWNLARESSNENQLIDCIGRILHEYVSPEVWNFSLGQGSSHVEYEGKDEDFPLHFLHDAAMLHQVIIEGIGIFNMCLGKNFAFSGFMHSSLYLLLENLVSPNFHVRAAADIVLHVISKTSGYLSVGQLVLENADYVIDSICQQLRHLNLNPHVPSVLAAMLSYIGVAEKILPLLEEPMRSVSLKLEILGRYQHPDLTIPFLKAVAEIAKSSKREALLLPDEAESFLLHVKAKLLEKEQRLRTESGQSSRLHHEEGASYCTRSDVAGCHVAGRSVHEELEEITFKLNSSKRYRRTIGSIAGSCLVTATPLLASSKQPMCLVALDILENGILALANVEAAYRHETQAKEAIEEFIQSCSLYQLQDLLDAADQQTDENRLLPAMNKIWPFFIVCVQNSNPAVVRRCLAAVSSSVQICGGDFFSRRFHTDGGHFWRLLTASPFHTKHDVRKERIPLQLPYRSVVPSSDEPMAEVSTLKVQAAVLNMIYELSQNKKSASALAAVLKKVTGLVVGIGCSGIASLQDACLNALQGLASIDPDLVWLLLADVYYSVKKKDIPLPPTSELPEIIQVLPPLSSPKEYLYVQYGGQTYGFEINVSAVGVIFRKLNSLVFSNQMYC